MRENERRTIEAEINKTPRLVTNFSVYASHFILIPKYNEQVYIQFTTYNQRLLHISEISENFKSMHFPKMMKENVSFKFPEDNRS